MATLPPNGSHKAELAWHGNVQVRAGKKVEFLPVADVGASVGGDGIRAFRRPYDSGCRVL